MHDVKILGIVGMGQMGRGITEVAAAAGFKTLVYDVSGEGLRRGMDFIEKRLLKGVGKGKWDEDFVRETLSRIETAETLDSLKDCDLVVEAATENKEVKFALFRDLDRICRPDAVLASNTSSISITEIAAETTKPGRVAGMHFMNPVPVMKLVEGISGLETDKEAFETVRATAEKMGKTFVAVRDVPGFAINRILMPMVNEAVYALYEGVATAEDIDTGMKLGANWPMGPLALADFIGLDTCLAIMDILYRGFGDTKYRPCPLLRQYVAAGRLGRKSGRGFYDYGGGA